MSREKLVDRASVGKVQILRVDEEKELPWKEFYASATITLIKGSSANYNLVDPDCFGEEKTVKYLLHKINLSPGRIDKVLITHNHPDHIGTIGLFENAEVYMPDSQFMVDRPNKFKITEDDFTSGIGGNKYLKILILN